MKRKLIGLAALAAMTCAAHLAFADGSGIKSGPNPSGYPVPSNGWSNPVPPTDWSGMPPTNNSNMPATSGMPNSANGEQRPSDHERELGIVSGGISVAPARSFIRNPASSATHQPHPIPGVDTHPTVEETPVGVEIIRGPASE